MKEFICNPIFGILISLIAFEIGFFIYAKTKLAIFNPLFISIILIITFLTKFNISLENYNKGAQFISFFLGPATVILAVPLYKKIKLLEENALPIIIGITSGSCIGITCIIFMCYLFKLDRPLNISMIPKSVTVPIGVEISKQLGGIPAVTVATIILTGIIGAIIGPFICKCFKIKNKVAIGIAIGTASHAVGTTKAIEIGETEGAMSGLSIGLTGLITVFIAPFIFKIFNTFL
ncbi:LrgB family protein [Clostridium aestuarii]|uniref:LrgB family protein n=1 Tax=Clostridium aestuarii TaxID=338193 RepID=A0ABT4D0L7_9CLOT|nr:LrgB family protein [Clostridium aestuarii]MCY6484785.1 LrgB family protein [Clostridium aestuarii]